MTFRTSIADKAIKKPNITGLELVVHVRLHGKTRQNWA